MTSANRDGESGRERKQMKMMSDVYVVYSAVGNQLPWLHPLHTFSRFTTSKLTEKKKMKTCVRHSDCLMHHRQSPFTSAYHIKLHITWYYCGRASAQFCSFKIYRLRCTQAHKRQFANEMRYEAVRDGIWYTHHRQVTRVSHCVHIFDAQLMSLQFDAPLFSSFFT